jgi:hypothetical protein
MWMSSRSHAVVVVALSVGLMAVTAAQTPQAPSTSSAATPQADAAQALARLSEAKDALGRVPEGSGALAQSIADLRRDFAMLQSMYVAQNATSAVPGAGSSVAGITTVTSTGAATSGIGTVGAGSKTNSAVGTSGSVAPATDWRTQYALVSSDVAMLTATGDDSNDNVRMALREFKDRLEKFFASTLGPAPQSPSAATGQSPSSATARPDGEPPPETRSNSEAIALLERMQKLLDRQQSDDGRTLKSAGKVTLDRADLDEIASEIQQLKVMLQR